ADVLVVDVDTVRARLADGVQQVAAGAIIDDGIDSGLAPQPLGFFFRADGADDTTALQLRDLADHRAHRTRSRGDEYGLARFRLAGGEWVGARPHPRHPHRAEVGRRGRRAGTDGLHHRRPVGEVVPPPPAARNPTDVSTRRKHVALRV